MGREILRVNGNRKSWRDCTYSVVLNLCNRLGWSCKELDYHDDLYVAIEFPENDQDIFEDIFSVDWTTLVDWIVEEEEEEF